MAIKLKQKSYINITWLMVLFTISKQHLTYKNDKQNVIKSKKYLY